MALIRKWSWVLGLIGVACLLVSVTMYWLFQAFDGRVFGYLVAGAISLVLYGVFNQEELKTTVTSRGFSYEVGSVLLQGLAVMLAVVGFVVVERYDKTWDFTENADYTLTQHTRTVIAGIDEPVRILAFLRPSGGSLRTERILKLYDEASDSIEVEWIDPLSNPQKAQLYEVSSGFAVILVQGERTQRLESDVTEERLTQKLVIVQSDADHIVCWAVGHGEADPDDEMSAEGLGSAVLAAEALNFQFLRANIATEGIDRECEALVVARPLQDWLPYEREAMAAFLAEGGRVMVLLDDAPVLYAAAAAMEGFPVPPTPDEFTAELERYGVIVGNDWVIDPDPRNSLVGVEDGSVLVLSGQGIVHHAITEGLGAAVIVRVARSVAVQEDKDGIAAFPLLRASTESWGETNLMEAPSPDLDGEQVGEVPVAAWVEIGNPDVLQVVTPPAGSPPLDEGVPIDEGRPDDPVTPATPRTPGNEPVDLRSDLGRAVPADFTPKAGGKLVVFGDADWASNQMLMLGNNRDLFLNTLAWMVDEEEQIGQRPNPAEPLDITGVEAGLLCLVSIVFVPGAAALLAMMTLLRRRFL